MISNLLNNGRGSWFLACRWCPAHVHCPHGNDELRALAAAKRSGWTIKRHYYDGWRVTCPECAARIAQATVAQG